MNILPQDIEWIKRKLREEFDEPKEIHNTDEYGQTIERALRFGLTELAEEMKSDLPFTPLKHFNQK